MSRSHQDAVARAIEALAADYDYEDEEQDTARIQLRAEERRINFLLRSERMYQDVHNSRAINRAHPSVGPPPDRGTTTPQPQHRAGDFCESFLEGMARQECKTQRSAGLSGENDNHDVTLTRVQQWHRLFSKSISRFEADFSGGGEDCCSSSSSSSSSSSGSSISEDYDDSDVELDNDSENEGEEDENILRVADDALIGNERVVNENGLAGQLPGANGDSTQRSDTFASVYQLLVPPASITFDSNISGVRGTNNFHRLSSLLVSLANSEENPLIRADIPWSVIIACGTPFMDNFSQTNSLLGSDILSLSPQRTSLLQTLYHQLDDPHGTKLLQGVLRMDPPLEVVQVLLDAFPLSCLDMEAFFTACQFAHPHTSRRSKGHHALHQDDGTAFDTDDVGEVIKLVMHETIRIRRMNNIDWGMVAFLGDARISPSHAKLLLQHFPEALNDSNHGTFEVSPLDRMASGYFIHGETAAWVEKLRIALRVTAYVRLRRKQFEQDPTLPKEITMPSFFFSTDCHVLRRRGSELNGISVANSSQAFYPYHELIRLITSPNFKGTRFGKDGFLKTLIACTESEPDAFLRMDNEGNLPIHIALRSTCETVLGVDGERRLIKYLLKLDPCTSLCPEGSESCGGSRRLPLRLSIENGWPVFDLIITAALSCGSSMTSNANECNIIKNRPLLHDALNGSYHPQFGIYFVREMTKYLIAKVMHHHHHSKGQKNIICPLTNPVDNNGRTALHVALASKWPVYDLLAQAYPNLSLEVRDPFGFFPFQIAACDFASHSRKESPAAEAPDAVTSGTAESRSVDEAEERKELIELSMLFEIIRECPHCVTCRPNELIPEDVVNPCPTKKRKFAPSSIE